MEVGESLAEALPPQPLAHDVPEPQALRRRLRRRRRRRRRSKSNTNGGRLARGRRERWRRHHGPGRGGRGGVMSNASQVPEHPPVQVLLSANVPPAHRQGVVLQQRRRTPLVRLKCAACWQRRRWWWRRREDQAEARQVVVLVDGGAGVQLVLRAEVERIHGRARASDRCACRRRACMALLGPRASLPIYTFRRGTARTNRTGASASGRLCDKSRRQTGGTRAACLTDRSANERDRRGHVESTGH